MSRSQAKKEFITPSVFPPSHQHTTRSPSFILCRHRRRQHKYNLSRSFIALSFFFYCRHEVSRCRFRTRLSRPCSDHGTLPFTTHTVLDSETLIFVFL